MLSNNYVYNIVPVLNVVLKSATFPCYVQRKDFNMNVIVCIVISVSLAVFGITLICATININSKCDAINDSVNVKFVSINNEIKAINQRFDSQKLLEVENE